MTNKSKYINTEECRKCGKCCETFSLCYPKSLEKEDSIMFSEVKRFQMLDTDLIEVIEKKDVFLVKFNFPCKHLTWNMGKCSCDIYNGDRPELCKQYPFFDTLDCPYFKLKQEGRNSSQD